MNRSSCVVVRVQCRIQVSPLGKINGISGEQMDCYRKPNIAGKMRWGLVRGEKRIGTKAVVKLSDNLIISEL